jgi:hypothetical protein
MGVALVVCSSDQGRPWALHLLFVQVLKVVHTCAFVHMFREVYTCCLFKCLRSSMDFTLIVCSSV